MIDFLLIVSVFALAAVICIGPGNPANIAKRRRDRMEVDHMNQIRQERFLSRQKRRG